MQNQSRECWINVTWTWWNPLHNLSINSFCAWQESHKYTFPTRVQTHLRIYFHVIHAIYFDCLMRALNLFMLPTQLNTVFSHCKSINHFTWWCNYTCKSLRLIALSFLFEKAVANVLCNYHQREEYNHIFLHKAPTIYVLSFPKMWYYPKITLSHFHLI